MKAPQWIVVIGASAGGVESLRQLFGALRADSDAVFLVVLHISPHSPPARPRALESIDKGLWDTIRSIEERVLLLRQMGELAPDQRDAASLNKLADDAEASIKALKDMVLDVRLFGRQR